MAFEYRRGPRVLIELPLAATSADITPGMAITATDAADGYFKQVDATSEAVLGIAVNKVSSPSSNGGTLVKLDVSTLSVYEAPPVTGTLAVTVNQNTCDVGADGVSIDQGTSTRDDILILVIDTDTNTALVRLAPILAGV